ncbi:hypothetical protein T439DRAFT_352194 [Meredithblackwellia eburnea MCA 4105]
MRFSTALLLASSASLASAHAVITLVTGSNGVLGQGFGIVNGTLRTGTDEQPFQTDTSVLKDLETDPCGATLRGGSINIAENLVAAETQGGGQLPSLSQNLSITMTLHQVNADGGGPFTVMFNTDGTGATWENGLVTQQAPGANALIRGGPNDAQFTAQLPSGTVCTGGSNNNACLIRLSNGGAGSIANGAGPFGGCLAVQQDSSSLSSTGVAVTSSTTTGTIAAAASTSTSSNFKSPKQKRAKILRGPGPKHRAKRAELASLSEREIEEAHRTVLKRSLLELVEKSVVARSLALTPGDLEDIKTATGTAIDIPIDALAGLNDEAATGGNSTSGKTGTSVLTVQQAFDLKSAVQKAIAAALAVLSNDVADTGSGANPDDTAAANALARQQIENGETSSVNAGNAGVGFPDTKTVASLLGALTLINTSEVVSGETPPLTVPGATATATATDAGTTTTNANAAVTVTVTASATSRRNRGNNRNNQVAAGPGGRHGVAKRRLRKDAP